MTLTQVGSNPVRVVDGDNVSGVLVNRDLVNIVYTGPSPNFNAGDPTASVHDPLVGIPYDGSEPVFAATAPGISVLMDFIANAQNWAPGPAQAAASISALGLATAANQNTQTTALNTGNTNTSTIATNTTGVAKDVTVSGISGQAGWLTSGLGTASNQTAANELASALGSPVLPIALNPNPRLTNPANGNADITGWSYFQANIATAGQGSANALPAGGGVVNGIKVIPTGSNTSADVSTGNAQISPGQLVQIAFLVYIPSGGPFNGQVIADWTVNGAYNSQNDAPLLTQMSSGWQIVSYTFTAPTNISGLNGVYGTFALALTAGGNVPAADVYYAGFGLIDSNVPGTTAGNHAQAIASTGTPLLHGYNNLINDTSVPGYLSIASGASVFPSIPISKPGYLISIAGEMAAAGTNPFLQVTMAWYDHSIGLAAGGPIAEETWWLPLSNTVFNLYTFGKGPTKGNYLQLQIKNESSQSVNVNLIFSETTQHIARDDWRSVAPTASNAVPGYTFAPNSNPLGLILAGGGAAGQAFTVSDQYIYLLPLYCGEAFIDFSGPGTASELSVAVADLAGNYMFSDVVGAGTGTNPGTNYRNSFYLPRQPCQLYIENAGPNAPICFWGLTIVEYAS
jgi:hypothetical protein